MDLQTFDEATRKYRLRDSDMSNSAIADHLQLLNRSEDHNGMPGCCFFGDGCLIVAIRTKKDELAIFHLYQMIQHKMEKIADRI